MINYLAKFAPQLSESTKPIRDLKDDAEFLWDQPQRDALDRTKAIILSQPVLLFFDPAKPITLRVDASKHGLGAALFQEDKSVAFASRSLNKTEQNYAEREKELYAILFGCRRFHQYLYGYKVTVQSDHKPLESIMKKPLSAAPPRLQRMFLQLQKYDLHVVHVPARHAVQKMYTSGVWGQRHRRRPQHLSPLPLQQHACHRQEDAAVVTGHSRRPPRCRNYSQPYWMDGQNSARTANLPSQSSGTSEINYPPSTASYSRARRSLCIHHYAQRWSRRSTLVIWASRRRSRGPER